MAKQIILTQTLIDNQLSGVNEFDSIIVTDTNTPHSIFKIEFNDIDDFNKLKESGLKYIYSDSNLGIITSYGGWIKYLELHKIDSVIIELLPKQHKWYVIASWYDMIYGQKQILGYNTI